MRSSVRALWLGALLLSACADQQESLILTHAPTWPDDGCVIDPGNEVSLIRGTLDVTQGTAYLMPAALLNNLSAQSAGENNAGIVTNEVQVTGADVTLESAQDPDMIAAVESMGESLVDFKVPVATISIPPGESRGFAIEVIPSATTVIMADYMLANHGMDAQVLVEATVVFHGSRAGTQVGKIGVIDAREFTFPIQLCQGCLLECGGCPEPGVCPAFEPGEFLGGVCGNAQDFPITSPACELSE